ncbi:MAG: proline racemase family protein [bacterium]|nr:proline racemase family protein [bacterium]
MAYNIQKLKDWIPPENWKAISTLDAHTEGEPLRIITSGFPTLKGNTILERRADALQHHDDLRTALMWEPRGHADMYGCIITDPVTPHADFGVIFMHNEGYSSMCGHGIVAVTTIALKTGMIQPIEGTNTIRIDSPAGLITAAADYIDGQISHVRFQNVHSFVEALDLSVDVPELGRITYDIAFGGAYYAYVDISQIGLPCLPEHVDQLISAGKKIKRAVMADYQLKHPFEDDLSFLYGTIFIGKAVTPENHSRNVCIFAEGEVDRSPTGTGVSGRLALHHARGEIKPGERIVIESIIGSTFSGTVVGETTFGPHQAVIPEVGGTARITGRHTFWIDPEDPLRNGFIMR